MSAPSISKTVIADSFSRRLFGLMGRRYLPEGEVWIFPRCRSIHTGFMRMAIDVVFLDADQKVTGLEKDVRSWRILRGPPGTVSVLEAEAGWLEVETGELVWKGPDQDSGLPRQS